MRAFHECSTDRHVGFAVGPIPFSAIDRYARRYGYDDHDEFRVLLDMIRAMDREYLAIVNKPTKPTGGSANG